MDVDKRPLFADSQYVGGFGNLKAFQYYTVCPNVAMGNNLAPYSGGPGLKPPTGKAKLEAFHVFHQSS
jgi:hypothetical protein